MKNLRYASVLLCAAFHVNSASPETPPLRTFVPTQPTTSDFIRLKTDIEGCYEEVFHGVTITEEPAIEVRFESPDTGCDPSIPENMQSPRFTDIGKLPAGIYATRIYGCGLSLPPEDFSCVVLEQGSITVAAVRGLPTTVPTASTAGLLALGSLLMLLGGRLLRR